MRRIVLMLLLSAAVLPAAASAQTPRSRVPIPAGWPHHLAVGAADSPGDAHALRAHSNVDVRYQYLAGGVNTGHG